MLAQVKMRMWAAVERSSLGAQVSLLSGLLCLAVVLATSVLSARIAHQQDIEQVQAEMKSLAGNLADRLDMQMFERVREFRNMAELKPLRGVWAGGPNDIRSVLEQLQSTLPDYAWIGFSAPDGRVRAATKGMLEGASVAQRPWFIEGLKGMTVQDVHDAKLLAEKLGPNTSGEPFRFVDVALPVHAADGRLLGVLGAHMSWDWAAEMRRTVLANLDRSMGTNIMILGGDGGALVGRSFGSMPFDAESLAAIKTGAQNTFIDDQAGSLSAAVQTKGFRDYPGLGWLVVASRPTEIAFGPARKLGLTIIAAGVVLAAIGAALTASLMLRLTKPLHQLAISLDLVGRDANATMVSRGKGSSDVVRLAGSIRSLLRRIGVAETQGEEAKQKAFAIEQRLEERTRRFGEDLHALQTLADKDPLTDLLNRRAFQVFAGDAMSYFRRYKRAIAVLVVDIDLFKRVNDTFGHATGDDIIRGVGNIISAAARTTDKVARFGGEEFVVLLRETDEAGLTLFAERVRAAIAAAPIETNRSGAVHVTVSIGLAMANEHDRDIEDLIERADRGLYTAKSAGRNCVRLGSDRSDMRRAA
jgi:diguanylate cyclase (GGDEF)-like protein